MWRKLKRGRNYQSHIFFLSKKALECCISEDNLASHCVQKVYYAFQVPWGLVIQIIIMQAAAAQISARKPQ